MESSFKLNCLNIWKSNFDRKNIKNEFTPVHAKYIGIENIFEYNNILKTYLERFNENNKTCIIFDNQIPFQANFELIDYVMKELVSMDVNHLENADIQLMPTEDLNKLFLNSLAYVVRLAIKQENFLNINIQNNFITKQILWAFYYIKNLEYSKNNTNKCLYYGNISKHEVYFLILLAKMNFDVIYINPLKEENWNIDSDKIFETFKFQKISQVESLKAKTATATVLNLEESIAVQLERDIEKEMFTSTGVFKPWQFRTYYPVSIFLKSTIIDLKNNWDEPSRIRQGFKIKDNQIFIPNYFQQIDGVYSSMEEYKDLVDVCTKSKHTIVVNNNSAEWIHPNKDTQKFQLTFCQLNDGSFDIERLKQLPFYKFRNFKIEIQNLILNKINECILDKNLFASPFDKDTVLDFIMLIFNLDLNIIKLLDSFDFPQSIPKIVIFLDGNNANLEDDFLLLLAFLQKCAFDIVIFNPAGLFDARRIINEQTIDCIRLEETNYDLTFKSLNNVKKKFSLFGKRR